MKIRDPGVMQEIRAVRDRMAERVEGEGVLDFYTSLRGRAAKLMARHRSVRPAPRPRSIAARKAKRHALVAALPVSNTLKELRRIREEMLAEETRDGGDTHCASVHCTGQASARFPGLKYADSPSRADVLHDKPVKKQKAHK